MYIVAICHSNYEVAKVVSTLVFGELNQTAASVFFSKLPTAYFSGASFHIKWHGHKLKVGYHVNGNVYLYHLNK